MNIQQAKEQICNAILAYRQKDAYGRLVIPQQRQRPFFLLGAPGIGKPLSWSRLPRSWASRW